MKFGLVAALVMRGCAVQRAAVVPQQYLMVIEGFPDRPEVFARDWRSQINAGGLGGEQRMQVASSSQARPVCDNAGSQQGPVRRNVEQQQFPFQKGYP